MADMVVQDLDRPRGVTVPAWITDLKSFTRWAESLDFPETGRFTYLRGAVWVDISMEQLLIHNRLKVRITTAMDSLVMAEGWGYVFGDGARLNNEAADLSVEPDVIFVSYNAIQTGRAALVEGAEEGYVRIEGSPELIVEIVSDSSEHKDTVALREAYFTSDVTEYWLVDARARPISFQILKRSSRGFTATRPQAGGWLKSAVFEKSFRLSLTADRLGNPQFTLEHRD